MPHTVALGEPTVGEAELAAVSRVFESGWLSGAGPTCREFESRFAVTAGTRARARDEQLRFRASPRPRRSSV